MLFHRLRRWLNIQLAFAQYFEFSQVVLYVVRLLCSVIGNTTEIVQSPWYYNQGICELVFGV